MVTFYATRQDIREWKPYWIKVKGQDLYVRYIYRSDDNKLEEVAFGKEPVAYSNEACGNENAFEDAKVLRPDLEFEQIFAQLKD